MSKNVRVDKSIFLFLFVFGVNVCLLGLSFVGVGTCGGVGATVRQWCVSVFCCFVFVTFFLSLASPRTPYIDKTDVSRIQSNFADDDVVPCCCSVCCLFGCFCLSPT